MTELVELLVVLGVIYLAECVRWVGRAAVLVHSHFPGFWSLGKPLRVAPQWRRALTVGAPWPPLGGLYVTEALPLRPGPNGLLVGPSPEAGWTRPATSTVHLPWSELSRLRIRDDELQLDGRAVYVFGSRRLIQSMGALLGRLKQAPEKQRLSLFEAAIDKRYELDEARRRLRLWRRWGTPSVVANNALFVALFGGIAIILFAPYRVDARIVVTVALYQWVVAGVLFELAFRRCLPPAVRPSVGRQLFTLLPLSLIRSADEVRTELLGDLDPLAVACALCSPRELSAAGARTLAEWKWPLAPPEGDAPEAAQQDDAWLRAKLARLAQKLFRQAGVELQSKKRRKIEVGSSSFCPRCETPYTAVATECGSCPGVRLQPFVPVKDTREKRRRAQKRA